VGVPLGDGAFLAANERVALIRLGLLDEGLSRFAGLGAVNCILFNLINTSDHDEKSDFADCIFSTVYGKPYIYRDHNSENGQAGLRE